MQFLQSKASSNFRSQSGQNLNIFVITLKKHEKWKVNESLRKVKSKMVDRALLCGASRGGVCVGGQKCEREQEEAGDSKRKDWRERGRAAEGAKGHDLDTCSYLNLQLLAEVTTEGLRREALYCSGL